MDQARDSGSRPPAPASAFDKALRAAKTRQWATAAALLQDWVQEHCDDRRAHELLALCYFRMGMWQRALEPAKRAVQLDPSSARAWCNLGTILRKLRRFDDAAAAQRRALRLDPGHERARVELAKIERDRRMAYLCAACGQRVDAGEAAVCPGCGVVYHVGCCESLAACKACGYPLRPAWADQPRAPAEAVGDRARPARHHAMLAGEDEGIAEDQGAGDVQERAEAEAGAAGGQVTAAAAAPAAAGAEGTALAGEGGEGKVKPGESALGQAAVGVKPKARRSPVGIVVGAAVVSLLIAAGAVWAVVILNKPDRRAWRMFTAAVAYHAAGNFAEAIRLYKHATETAPGLAAAYVAWAWAELEVCPFAGPDDISYRLDAEECLTASLESLAQQAKWGRTQQLDRADWAAWMALRALQQRGLGYERQVAAGLKPAPTAALAYGTLALTALLRAYGNVMAFADQVQNAVNAPGSTSANLAALRKSTVLADAIAWCSRAEQYGQLADAKAPELHLGTKIAAAAREMSQQAYRLSCMTARLEELARIVEELDRALERLREWLDM